MYIRKEYLDAEGKEVWEIVVDYVKRNGAFKSVTGIPYSATFVGSCIFLKGGSGSKRACEGEYLTGKDFITAYDRIKTLEVINTAKVKPYIKRQQTPFIGLLVCAGIIVLDGINDNSQKNTLF